MGKRHPKYSLVKIHRNYTVDDTARLLGVHKNTVRVWIKAGLPVLNEKRPVLILGPVLKDFLIKRRGKNKRPCNPGQLYCCKCRSPKYPASNRAEYHQVTDKLGNLVAQCSTCRTVMNQLVSLTKTGLIRSKIKVSFPEAQRQLNESEKPSVNSDFRKETKTNEKAPHCKRKNQATLFDFLERREGAK